jgi:hypothetical protein
MDNHHELLNSACRSFSAITGLDVSLEPGPSEGDGLIVHAGGRDHRFEVVVQPYLTRGAAGTLVARIGDPGAHPLVVSERIAPPVGEILRAGKLHYLDTAGNCLIHDGPLFIMIEGQKAETHRKTEPVRAFQEAGLRLIFQLLLDEERASATYRELASQAGVSRGAVGYVMADLMELGFVVDVGGGRRRLTKREALLDRWTVGYGERLRPKLFRGRYRFSDEDQRRRWRDMPIGEVEARWGGEPAAALVTDYIRPEVFTLYSDAPPRRLAQRLQVVPDEAGPIELVGRFWSEAAILGHTPETDAPVVPRLLAYADLIASGDQRNLEVARALVEPEIAGPTS